MHTGKIDRGAVELYYICRGSGPLLLILQGGAGNAEGSEALVGELEKHFTVVTYDRRGLSRSTPVRGGDFEIATHASDAAALIAALSSEPAYVFGSSMGALIAVELAASHPKAVRRLVAHEPPAYRLLKGSEQEDALRGHMEIIETFQREGLAEAMKLMLQRSGVDINDREVEVQMPTIPASDPQAALQRAADLKHLISFDVPAVDRYYPRVDALRAASDKIVPAVGQGSRSILPYRCTEELAAALGLSLTEFPGGHTGYVLHPRAFAAKLAEVLLR